MRMHIGYILHQINPGIIWSRLQKYKFKKEVRHTTSTLTTFLTAMTEIVTWFLSKFASILTLYTTEPVLMIPFTIFVVGAIIGLVGRLTHR